MYSLVARNTAHRLESKQSRTRLLSPGGSLPTLPGKLSSSFSTRNQLWNNSRLLLKHLKQLTFCLRKRLLAHMQTDTSETAASMNYPGDRKEFARHESK